MRKGRVKASHLDNRVPVTGKRNTGTGRLGEDERFCLEHFKCLWNILTELSCGQKDTCF